MSCFLNDNYSNFKRRRADQLSSLWNYLEFSSITLRFTEICFNFQSIYYTGWAIDIGVKIDWSRNAWNGPSASCCRDLKDAALLASARLLLLQPPIVLTIVTNTRKGYLIKWPWVVCCLGHDFIALTILNYYFLTHLCYNKSHNIKIKPLKLKVSVFAVVVDDHRTKLYKKQKWKWPDFLLLLFSK
jgi:hypothetical protein